MKKLTSLSIFFPALNDAESLPSLIKRADSVAKKVALRYEILVIDDGSSDQTGQVIQELQKTYHELRYIKHEKNLGYGGALISGFRHSRYEWTFYTDGDGQYDPRELLLLVLQAQDGIDVVNGYKTDRSDSYLRTIIGILYNRGLHMILPLPARDVDCDFRLLKTRLVHALELTSSSGAICAELVYKLGKQGAVFRNVRVHHFARLHGRSQFFSFPRVVATFRDITKLVFSRYLSDEGGLRKERRNNTVNP